MAFRLFFIYRSRCREESKLFYECQDGQSVVGELAVKTELAKTGHSDRVIKDFASIKFKKRTLQLKIYFVN